MPIVQSGSKHSLRAVWSVSTLFALPPFQLRSAVTQAKITRFKSDNDTNSERNCPRANYFLDRKVRAGEREEAAEKLLLMA